MRVRQIEVRQGDDLRAIALRELSDATRWAEIAQLNDLRLPFVVESIDPSDRLANTVVWGDRILIPWDGNGAYATTPVAVFGVDVALGNGQLAVSATGDLATVGGADNVVQALGDRLKTMRGELVYHPQYGSFVSLALGLPNGPFSGLMAASWTHEALVEEPRLSRVVAVDAASDGDVLRIAARVEAVGANTPIDLNLVLNP